MSTPLVKGLRNGDVPQPLPRMHRYRALLLTFMCAQILLGAGVVYGWPALETTLVDLGVYASECAPVHPSVQLKDTTACHAQLLKLNSIYVAASWGCQAEGNTPDDGTASILAVDTSGRPMGGIPLRHRGAGIVTIVATTDQSGWATVPLDDEMEIDPYLWGSFPRAVTIQPGSTAVLVMPRTCLVEVEISGPHLDPDEELIAAFESQGWPFSQSLVVLKGKGDQRIQGRVPCGSTNISIEGPKLHAPVRLHDEQVEDGWRFEGSLDPGRLVEATVVDSHGAPLADIFLGEAGFTHARTNREGRVVARIDSRGDRELRMVSPSFKPYPIPVSAGKNNINLGTIVMTTKR